MIWDRITGDRGRLYSVSLRKDSEEKRGNYLEKGNILFAEEKKKEENIWRKKNTFWERRNTEKEKEENIWRKKKYFLGGGETQRRKRRKIFGEGKNIFWGGEGNEGKYLEEKKIIYGGEDERRRKSRQISLRRKDWR